LEGQTGAAAAPACVRSGLAAGRPPELESRLGTPKFGAKDGGGGLCVPKGRCTSLKWLRFGLEEENAASTAMERRQRGKQGNTDPTLLDLRNRGVENEEAATFKGHGGVLSALVANGDGQLAPTAREAAVGTGGTRRVSRCIAADRAVCLPGRGAAAFGPVEVSRLARGPPQSP
jgi:hypothetical protein